MYTTWKTMVWRQFGAAIDMLENALRACPDELWHSRLWHDPSKRPEFWYVVYHTLFWLDLYLYGAEEGFTPPSPFTLIEQDDNGPFPERPYTNEELQDYLDACRQKCQATIEGLTDAAVHRRCRFGWGEVTFAELLLYNMRHVQEHAAHLSLLLGQKGVPAPDWVAWAGEFSDQFHDGHEPDVRAWLAQVDHGYGMINTWKTSIWQQFGAAIDTLEDALRACPEELWRGRLWDDPERAEYGEFWFLVYHTLKWLDLYLNGTAEGFAPPERFQRYEKDADGLPLTPYTKGDLQAYLGECRQKCQTTIEALTEETAQRPCYFEWIGVEMSFAELLLYSMRHVQEHAAQLSLLLGQEGFSVPDSVARADERAG